MGKFLCECGYIISDTCGSEGELFIDYELHEEKSESLGVFECPKCGNIMIDDPRDPKKVVSYKPITGIYNKILHDHEYIRYEITPPYST